MEKQNIQAKDRSIGACLYKVFVTLTTRAASLPAFVPFPVALTSNEIPFLSFGTLLQPSGCVEFSFQLLP